MVGPSGFADETEGELVGEPRHESCAPEAFLSATSKAAMAAEVVSIGGDPAAARYVAAQRRGGCVR